MSEDVKRLVQQQFGAASEAYATSGVHARGESLELLVKLIRPQKHWCALDVGTGAGHTALSMAPHVAHVVASDLTPEMLARTAELASKQGISNLETLLTDAESLSRFTAGYLIW